MFPLNFQRTLGSDLFCDCSKHENLFIKSFLEIKKDLGEQITNTGNYLKAYCGTPDYEWSSVLDLFQSTNTFAWAPSLTSPGQGTLIHPPRSLNEQTTYLPTSWITHETLHDKAPGACCTGPGLLRIFYMMGKNIRDALVWTGNPKYAECALLLDLYRTPSGLTV